MRLLLAAAFAVYIGYLCHLVVRAVDIEDTYRRAQIDRITSQIDPDVLKEMARK